MYANAEGAKGILIMLREDTHLDDGAVLHAFDVLFNSYQGDMEKLEKECKNAVAFSYGPPPQRFGKAKQGSACRALVDVRAERKQL